MSPKWYVSVKKQKFLRFSSVVFIHQCLYSRLLCPGLFFSSVIFFTQTVGLLGRVVSPSQGHYLHIGQSYMPWTGFEPIIPAFERAKAVNVLDLGVIVIWFFSVYPRKYPANTLERVTITFLCIIFKMLTYYSFKYRRG
jgi:hypothetical protein